MPLSSEFLFSSDAIKSKTACFKDVMQLRASTIDMKTSELDSLPDFFTSKNIENFFLVPELTEAETELTKFRVSQEFKMFLRVICRKCCR